MLLRSSAIVLAALLSSATAFADVSDGDRATARALAQQGQDALDHKDYKTAVDRFERAWQLIAAPTIALGLARAQAGLGRLVAAQETYNRILRAGAPANAPAVFAKAVADARTEVDALEPRIPSVTINVSGSSAARVTLDGAPLPPAVIGVSRPVDPGNHVVRAEADGFQPAEASIVVHERKSESITLTLLPLAAGDASPRADRGASEPEGGPGSRTSVQRTLGLVGIGVGGAGLVVGIIGGAIALGKHSSLAKLCPDGHCQNQQPAIDSYHVMANVSTGGFVAGTILAATGIALFVTAPKAAPQASIAPFVGPGYAGARGSF